MKLPMSNPEILMKQIFDDYFHQLVLSAFHYVQDYDQAEDIVQDVFVKFWQNVGELGQQENLKAYLFKAVKNSCLNFLRHIKVRRKFIDEAQVLSSQSEELKDESLSDEDINNRIHQAITKLPDHWREAFVLSKYDKLKYHEIATKLNISPKTVEKYLSKSLQFLREELKDLVLMGIIIFFF